MGRGDGGRASQASKASQGSKAAPSRSAASTRAKGTAAEDCAVTHLRAQGYRIVERNFRCKMGEIDIVAEEHGVLVFVEVRSKRHAHHGSALETVTATKQAQIAKVAQQYLHRHGLHEAECRFDVVGITGDVARHRISSIELVRDAFRLGD